MFDFNDYTKSVLTMVIEIRKSRKFSEDASGPPINEVFMLKSKMYSFLKNIIDDGNDVAGDKKPEGKENWILRKN